MPAFVQPPLGTGPPWSFALIMRHPEPKIHIPAAEMPVQRQGMHARFYMQLHAHGHSARPGRLHAGKLPGPGKPCAPVLSNTLHPAPHRIPPWPVAVVVRFWTSPTCPAAPACQSPWPLPPSSPGRAERGRPGVAERGQQGPLGTRSPHHLP